MYEKSDPPQWSVHAEVTISHDGQSPSGQTHTEQNGNELRMVYTWTTNPATEPEPRPPGNQTLFQRPDQSETYRNFQRGEENRNQPIFQRPDQPETCRNYVQRGFPTELNPSVFQRGGMVFTSVPPRQTNYDPTRLGVPDSGYNSELLSPSSCQTSRRPILPYNRRCRSTCSIILNTAINTDAQHLTCDTSVAPSHHQCGRTQSLRCQTPSIKPDRRDSYYGCGDPWCYHADERRCSPVLENCEECSSVSSKRTSRANTFTTHFCTRVPERNRSSPPNLSDFKSKDMTTQTVETSEKCTSPLEKIERKDSASRKKTVRRRSSAKSSRRNSDSNTLSPPMFPETVDNKKSSKRVTRSPRVRGRSPLMEKRSPPQEPPKKQRTVHIDVYCTGSDCSDSESSTESEGTHSSPQTVFESEKCRISHRRADHAELPYSLQSFLKENNMLPERKAIESDEETAYPSALSSYSTMQDFESSLSSVPASWSGISSSTCTVPDGYDSVAATSCKDTVSDFESLIQKRFSLVPDESEYFIPRKLNADSKISSGNFSKSDSFEYEDAADRERIKNMEELWAGDQTWKSPSAERKFMLQQQRMREYLERRVKEKRQQKESETESAEDDSEQGWIVRPSGETNLKREDTVRRVAELKPEQLKIVSDPNKHNELKKFSVPVPEITTKGTKGFQNTVQPSSSCNSIITQRLNPHLRKPFTLVPGIHTDQ